MPAHVSVEFFSLDYLFSVILQPGPTGISLSSAQSYHHPGRTEEMAAHITFQPGFCNFGVADGDFRNNNGVVSVDFGRLHEIGKNSFARCENLKTVNFGDVSEIGEGAFKECSYLELVDLSNVRVIGKEAFWWCKELKTVVLSSELTEIPLRAFYYCYKLEDVQFSESIRHIRMGAFSSTNLINFKLPSQLLTIASDAFSNCGNIKKVTIPAKVHSIGYAAFYNCGLEMVVFLGKPGRNLAPQAFGSGRQIKKVVLPSKARQYIQKRLSFLHAFTSRKMNPADWKTIGMPRTMKDRIVTIILCLNRRRTVVPGTQVPILPWLPYELVLIILRFFDTGYLLLTK